MTTRSWTASIRSGSPNEADLRRVFGSDDVPLKSPLPRRARVPGAGEIDFYDVDVAALDPGQLERAVVYFARQFDEREDVVRGELLGEHGFPIRAEHVVVSIPLRFFV